MSTRPEPEREGAVGIAIRVALGLRFERDACVHGHQAGALRSAEQARKHSLNITIIIQKKDADIKSCAVYRYTHVFCGEFGWVAFLSVFCISKINPDPQNKHCCGK